MTRIDISKIVRAPAGDRLFGARVALAALFARWKPRTPVARILTDRPVSLETVAN